ncbi:TPA: hypothetical protein ACQ0F8_001813 [Streptococcus agalactiae]|nr:hypothetical protein [Streptococcus agalactiae]HEO4177378.1 hypothetical protein [Streptococcus agalactiae]
MTAVSYYIDGRIHTKEEYSPFMQKVVKIMKRKQSIIFLIGETSEATISFFKKSELNITSSFDEISKLNNSNYSFITKDQSEFKKGMRLLNITDVFIIDDKGLILPAFLASIKKQLEVHYLTTERVLSEPIIKNISTADSVFLNTMVFLEPVNSLYISMILSSDKAFFKKLSTVNPFEQNFIQEDNYLVSTPEKPLNLYNSNERKFVPITIEDLVKSDATSKKNSLDSIGKKLLDKRFQEMFEKLCEQQNNIVENLNILLSEVKKSEQRFNAIEEYAKKGMLPISGQIEEDDFDDPLKAFRLTNSE